MRKGTREERLRSRFAEEDQEVYDRALGALLSHKGGRAFLWRLLDYGKIGSQPFTSNALTTSFNCGELNVGNRILADIVRVDAANYVQMIQEKDIAERERTEQLADAAADPDADGAD